MSNTAKSNAPGPAIRDLSSDELARIFEDIKADGMLRDAWDALSPDDQFVLFSIRNTEVVDLLAQLDTQADAQRTLDSLAVMLGWGNTPPRHIFEAEIRALKAQLDTLTRERDELEAQSLEDNRQIVRLEAQVDRVASKLKAAEATVATLKVDYVENQATLTRLCLMLNAENFSELEATVATLEQEKAEAQRVFNAHVEAVGEFLNDLYAIMVDPLADGYASVGQMKDAIREAALRDRDTAAKFEALERQVAHLRTYAQHKATEWGEEAEYRRKERDSYRDCEAEVFDRCAYELASGLQPLPPKETP